MMRLKYDYQDELLFSNNICFKSRPHDKHPFKCDIFSENEIKPQIKLQQLTIKMNINLLMQMAGFLEMRMLGENLVQYVKI